MSEPEVEAQTAILRHSITVYDAMESQANILTADGGTEMLVYEGKLTELVTVDCGLSVPYYSKVTQAIKRMGCARQLRRGGGNSPSQWELITQPTDELYAQYLNEVEPEEEVPEYATLQQLQDLNKRLLRLEKAVGL